MPKLIALRTLTTEEEAEIRRLANSCKEPLRLVQRARVIAAMLDDPSLPAKWGILHYLPMHRDLETIVSQ